MKDLAQIHLDWVALHIYGICRIPLHGSRGKGLYALVDAEDYPMVGGDRWYLAKNGYVARNPPTRHGIRQGQVYMHRIVMGDKKGVEIDHKDLLRLNNRKSNLRYVTRAQNNANHPTHKHSHIGIKGVGRTRSGRFRARIHMNGKEIHLGVFPTTREAMTAYNDAAIAAYGEHARIGGLNDD